MSAELRSGRDNNALFGVSEETIIPVPKISKAETLKTKNVYLVSISFYSSSLLINKQINNICILVIASNRYKSIL